MKILGALLLLGSILHADTAGLVSTSPTAAPLGNAAVATPAPTPLATAMATAQETPQAAAPVTPVAVITASPSPDTRASMAVTVIATPPGSPPPPGPSREMLNVTEPTSQGSASAVAVSRLAQPFGHSGVVYMFSLANWVVFNNTALAYTPVELGYDFGNGVRLLTGYDIFYYEGEDASPSGTQKFSYQMSDWRTSAIYRYPMTLRLRPIVGVSLDFVGGSRTLSPYFNSDGIDANANASASPAWGFIGIGAIAGLEYLVNRDWSLQLSEHYIADFGDLSYSPTVTQLGVMVVF